MGRYDITVKYFAAKYPQAYIRLALGAVFGPSTPAQEVQAVSAFRLLGCLGGASCGGIAGAIVFAIVFPIVHAKRNQ